MYTQREDENQKRKGLLKEIFDLFIDLDFYFQHRYYANLISLHPDKIKEEVKICTRWEEIDLREKIDGLGLEKGCNYLTFVGSGGPAGLGLDYMPHFFITNFIERNKEFSAEFKKIFIVKEINNYAHLLCRDDISTELLESTLHAIQEAMREGHAQEEALAEGGGGSGQSG